MCQIAIGVLRLVLLLLLVSYTEQQNFNISPSDSFTLQDLANQTDALAFNATVEIVLMSGNHSLSSELKVSQANQISVRGEQNTKIICHGSGAFDFKSITYMDLYNVEFIDCKAIRVESVKCISLENCRFLCTCHTINITMLHFINVTANITECTFNTEHSQYHFTSYGRSLLAKEGRGTITNSTFCDGMVIQNGDHTALIYFFNSIVVMKGSTIRNNRRSLLVSAEYCQQVVITDSSFVNNSVCKCTLCASHSNISLKRTNISENTGSVSVVFIEQSTMFFRGEVRFLKNNGSFLILSSTVTLNGINTFEKCTQTYKNVSSNIYQAESTFTILRSTVKFCGTTLLLENHSDKSGGALYVSESEIQVQGNLKVAKNSADNGGGAFFYFSIISSSGKCIFTENEAKRFGGGIHAIGTTIILRANYEELITYRSICPSKSNITHSLLNFSGNAANCSGGAIHLEGNSKIFGFETGSFTYTIEFFQNKASNKGGAIYVNDSTYPGVCASISFATYNVQTECFFQAIYDYHCDSESEHEITQHIKFSDNSAKKGSILYGGLLDRCTVNPQSSVYSKTLLSTKPVDPFYGLSYFQHESRMNYSIDGITSGFLRICICQENEDLDCNYVPSIIHAKKGETFNIAVAVVDQVNNSFNESVAIRGYLNPNVKDTSLMTGQLQNTSTKQCTKLNFAIYSTQKSIINLVLYIDGAPCEKSGLSSSTLKINIDDCTLCPIGFQHTQSKTNCECECHKKISKHVICYPNEEKFQKKQNSWIGYINQSNSVGYIVYPNCPYDFCLSPESVNISLNDENGFDAQCASNRSGLLCGQCKKGFQLSMGIPICIQCSKSLISTYILGFIVAAIGGVVIIALFLILNLTVAQGTINGLIFYANIVLMSRSAFFPLARPDFFTELIYLLNTQSSMHRCFPSHIDEYQRIWHRIIFPLYLLFLVMVVVIISKYSSKCARLIGKRNPVATLATVILLVYAQLLQMVIDTFSFAILENPEGTKQAVWRPDASIKYLRGKHIALFLAAVVIMTASLAYTFLLFTWQWLTRVHNIFILRWIRNAKLNSFIDAYHAPYKPKYRFWTGLLLLIRILLNVAATINVLSNPKYTLFTIIILIASLLLLKACLGEHIYKQRLLDYFESTCYFNLLVVSLVSLGSVGNKERQAVYTKISVSVTFLMTLTVLLYHIYFTLCKRSEYYKRIKTTLFHVVHIRKDRNFFSAKDRVVQKKSSTEISLSKLLECSGEEECVSSPIASINLRDVEKNSKHVGDPLNLSSLREPLIDDC